MSEINQLIQTARLNFVDSQFSNWLNVNKYFNLLKVCLFFYFLKCYLGVGVR